MQSTPRILLLEARDLPEQVLALGLQVQHLEFKLADCRVIRDCLDYVFSRPNHLILQEFRHLVVLVPDLLQLKLEAVSLELQLCFTVSQCAVLFLKRLDLALKLLNLVDAAELQILAKLRERLDRLLVLLPAAKQFALEAPDTIF